MSTIAIYDYSIEGATRDEIAVEFDLSVVDVRWALAYEDARHAS